MTSYLVWCDIEATDKDPVHAKILEIAFIVTSLTLKPLAKHHGVVRFTMDVLNPILADWSRETHTKSGLIRECLSSPHSLTQVENACLEFLRPFAMPCHVGKNLILAGSAIAFDMTCIRREMPRLADLFHYRTLDVNSWMLPISWWFPEWHQSRPERNLAGRHRAESDILNSLHLMQYYWTILKKRNTSGEESPPSGRSPTRSYASCLLKHSPP